MYTECYTNNNIMITSIIVTRLLPPGYYGITLVTMVTLTVNLWYCNCGNYGAMVWKPHL